MAWDGTKLYAAGNFSTTAGPNAKNIALWDGNNWTAVGNDVAGGSTNPPQALLWDGTRLYAGGNFSTSSGAIGNYVAQWDGITWSALGAGPPCPVRALARGVGKLFAGGDGTGSPAGEKCLAQWDGTQWTLLGSDTNGPVNALAWDADQQRLFVGGAFTRAGCKAASIAAAEFDGDAIFADGFEACNF
jgi:hypothetical protein